MSLSVPSFEGSPSFCNPDAASTLRRVATRLARLGAGFALVSLAASADAATISGRVRDGASNSFLLGVNVTVVELGRNTVTTPGGSFHFADVPAGDYTLRFSSLGHAEGTERVSASDAGTAEVEVVMKSDLLQLDKMVVEGTREGQARALQQKRSATNIIDVVSADAVGKLPDGNAAEALRRVPGISVQVDQDEGRYVVVRGLSSALNTVTLNNQLIGTPSEQGNRGIAMDSVPADLIARMEVVKAVTPDMDANAIGGSINIVTQSAFDRAEPFLYGSVGGFHDRFSGQTTPNGSVTAGTVFGADKRWGVVAGASYSLKEVSSQTANTRSWTQVNGFWLPTTQQSYDYDIERERIGANVALQFRPMDGHELAVRVNHNEFSDVEARQSVLYEYRLGTLSNQTPTSGANSGGRASRQYRDYHQTGTIDAASIEGKHTLGDYLLTWQAGASRGERDVPTRVDWEYRSGSNAFPNTYDLSGEELVITPNTDAYYNPANFPFRRVRFRSDIEREDVYSAQVDLKRELSLAGRNAFWKVGAKFVTRDKKDDRTNQNYTLASGAANAFTLAEPGLAGPEPLGYFNGLYRLGPTLNLEGNKAFFAANPNRFTFDPLGSLNDSIVGDFEASEDVYAGYAMGSIELTKPLTLLAGVRVETTKTTYGANEISTPGGGFTGVYRWVEGGNDYTDVLPGVHLTWRPNDRLVARAAITGTLSRANYVDLVPTNAIDAIETEVGSGRYTGSISSGNPELDPYESLNFDASVEYYLKNAGLLSVGFFHKDIDNPVYENSTFQTNVTVDGRFYETLSRTRPENADQGKITGVEFNYQQFFKQLPAPFDGLGINLNYTLVDSSVNVFGRSDELPFFQQSDRIGNAALFYEKYRIEARLALSYTSDYLDAVGSNRDTDIFVRGRMPLDAKVTFRVNKNFRIFLEALNLTEEPLREYTGIRARENDYEIYEMKARFGINFTL